MNKQEATMDDYKKLLADFCEYDNANIPVGLADEEGEEVVAVSGPPVRQRKGKRAKVGEATAAEIAAAARANNPGRKKWALNEAAQRVSLSRLSADTVTELACS